jgi:hypothetical protein
MTVAKKSKRCVTIKWLVALLICLSGTSSVSAETKVYKQVDPNGNITFTDTPPIDNTQTVEEITVNVHSSGVVLDRESQENESTEHLEKLNKEQAEKEATEKAQASISKKSYSISITTPKSGQMFTPDTLEIISGVEVSPPLEAGHRLQVLLDNSPVLPPQRELGFKLPFLPAGNHELKVQIVGPEGEILKESAPVKLTQMRVSSPEPLPQ